VHVLIADDDSVSRRLLQVTVQKWGHEVVTATDGIEAWHQLEKDDGPRLAIVDWMMPGMDGLEVCRRARERAVPYVYIVLLTARDKKDDLLAAFDAGADDFLTKPMDASELRARLRTGQRVLELQSSLLEVQDALRHEATHDPLTGLSNRGAIFDALVRETHRAGRQAQDLSVVLIDLDEFKLVNDTHGHQAGDAVLREAAQRIRAAVRPYDSLGRYGGEEFLVLLPSCGMQEAAAIAERIRAQICGEPIEVDGKALSVSASLGVASQRRGPDSDSLVRMADEAMYRAKAAGRNRVELATE
jgi:two-component system cell cycle response regulator